MSKFKFLHRTLVKKGMPLQFTYFVTGRCNARCYHCFYWKQLNKAKKELTLEEINKFSKTMGNLLLLNLTGGEPFLRNDLPEIAETFYKNNKVDTISIPTNGLLPKIIKNKTAELLEKCPNSNVFIAISIDGLEKQQDKMRGVKGAFKKNIQSLQSLKDLKKDFSNLSVAVNIILSHDNQHNIDEVYDYVLGIKPDNIAIGLVRGDTKEKIAKDINIEIYKKITNRFKQDIKSGKLKYYKFPYDPITLSKDFLTHEILYKTHQENKYLFPCFAGNLNAVMYEEGDIYPCEMLPKMKLGNIRNYNYDFKKLWYSEKAKQARRFIKETNCFCTHECYWNTNIIFNPKLYPKMLKSIFTKKYILNKV